MGDELRNQEEIENIRESLRILINESNKRLLYEAARSSNIFAEHVVAFGKSKRDNWSRYIFSNRTVNYIYDVIHLAKLNGLRSSDLFEKEGIKRYELNELSLNQEEVPYGKDKRYHMISDTQNKLEYFHLVFTLCKVLGLELEDLLDPSNAKQQVNKSKYRKEIVIAIAVIPPLAIILRFLWFWYAFQFSTSLKVYSAGAIITTILLALIILVGVRGQKRNAFLTGKRKILRNVFFGVVGILSLGSVSFWILFADAYTVAGHYALESYEGPVWFVAIPIVYLWYLCNRFWSR